MHHDDSINLPYRCEQLFALVADIGAYPEFIPGWSRVRILQADEAQIRVAQTLRFGLIKLRFHSYAELDAGKNIRIRSSDAPFGDIAVDWSFDPLPDDGCRLGVQFEVSLKGGLLKRPLTHLLAQHSDQLLDVFARRAAHLYG